MRARLLRAAGLLLGLGIVGFVVPWLLFRDSSLNEKRRYEDALLGKTLDQVNATMNAPPVWYMTKDDWQKQSAEPLQWPDEEAANALWIKGLPPREDMILVVFDKAGLATRVGFSSWASFPRQLQRWLPF